MIKSLIGVSLSCLILLLSAKAQDVNVLIIGSTHSYSEGGEGGVLHEKPFNPSGIATQLQSVLSQDPAIGGAANVVFEDIYTNQFVARNVNSYFHRYTLAQYFMWPDGKTARRANLRGEGAYDWDYIILCADPYVLANFPGMYAEGVKLIHKEVSMGNAQLVLFAQWPENASAFTAAQFNEIVYRVGNSAGVPVVAGGKAWDSFTQQDANAAHPTPKGQYLAAACIYSGLFNRNASSSGYTYDDTIADHALNVIQANAGGSQYSGDFTSINTFQMKYVKKRHINFRETGTSTENGMHDAFTELPQHQAPEQGRTRIQDIQRITITTNGYNDGSGTRWDFNYGRGNDGWERAKQYEVNPDKYDRSYGFPMHYYNRADAPYTMPYGIDKQYRSNGNYTDGTDLGIAYNMIRPGTRELSLPEDVRAIPIRLMWLKMNEASPGLNPLQDNTHMRKELNNASSAFMYTLLSGRCPVYDEPTPQGSPEWLDWLGYKIGYETAWQMAHLTTRAPGFRVLPSSADATAINLVTSETMSVQFINPPQDDVTVTISLSNPSVGVLSTQSLVFTPQNHNTPQQVTIMAIDGAADVDVTDVVFTTSSDDEVYDGLWDSWEYSLNRRTAPIFTSQSIRTSNAPRDHPYSDTVAVTATDADGDVLSYSKASGPDWLVVASNGELSGTPSITDVGENVFSITVIDDDGNSDTATLAILVSRINAVGQLGVLDTTLGGGINPATGVEWQAGDQYRLIFVASDILGNSVTTVDALNAHVNSDADGSTAYPNLGDVIWSAVASDASIDARDNTGTNPTSAGVPIFIFNNTLIAHDNADLWDGSIAARVNIDRNGQLSQVNNGWVWTGTNSDGTKYEAAYLGAGNRIRIGKISSTNASWVDTYTQGNLAQHAGIYAISEVLALSGPPGGEDATAPNPNPMSFALFPVAPGGSQTEITMTATTATDAAGVEYYFAETSGNPGGSDSGWQDSPNYTDTGLQADTQYMYTVTARDKSANQNITAPSSPAAATTWVGVPSNTPPSWNSNPVNKPNATEDIAYVASLSGEASDVDEGASLTYAKVSGPEWLNVALNGELTGAPSNGDVGENEFVVSVSDGIAPAVEAILNITVIHNNAGSSFSAWILGYPALGGQTGFSDDPDGDRLSNGIESFFGTDPGIINSGLAGFVTDGTTSSFSHPQNSVAVSDVTALYEWSMNLVDWYAGDGADGPNGGPTVNISPNTDGGTTTVTAVSSHALNSLYLRIRVEQNPTVSE